MKRLTPTNWDHYYSNPPTSASFTRKISEKILLHFLQHYGSKNPRMMELGGANSCFFEAICNHVQPSDFDVMDTNTKGLALLEQKARSFPSVRVQTYNQSALRLSNSVDSLRKKYDIVLSVGLIEHFDQEETRQCLLTHFDLLNDQGIAVITFPTPTLLYRLTRKVIELLGKWIFTDERPLTLDEVKSYIPSEYEIVASKLNWMIFLSQWVLVIKKKSTL